MKKSPKLSYNIWLNLIHDKFFKNNSYLLGELNLMKSNEYKKYWRLGKDVNNMVLLLKYKITLHPRKFKMAQKCYL